MSLPSPIYQATDFVYNFIVKDTDGAALILDDNTTTLYVRTYVNRTKEIGSSVELQVVAETTTATDGKVAFTFTDTDTGSLDAGRYIYEIRNSQDDYTDVQERQFFTVEEKLS